MSRARRAQEIARGNVNAMKHGAFAVVAAMPDVATEVVLTYAGHPGLDLIADRRLVEQAALAMVQHRRAIVAMQTEGMSAVLTSYESRLAALAERLERAVFDRERMRIASRHAAGVVDLSSYREGAPA